MLILGPASVIKIYKGSKNSFAYTMTAYTCVFGLTFVALGALVFPQENGATILFLYLIISTTGYLFKDGSLRFNTLSHQLNLERRIAQVKGK